MAKINFAEVVEQICEKDPRFSTDAYHFVQEGLNHTLKALKRGGQHTHRHVSGQELLHGLREFALKEYGPMSKAVLNEWGIKTTDDFGQVVFNLVNDPVGQGLVTSLARPGGNMTGFSFIDAGFTMRRLVTAMISSTTLSLLARSVLPVSTRSTMASARPTSGASSIEP